MNENEYEELKKIECGGGVRLGASFILLLFSPHPGAIRRASPEVQAYDELVRAIRDTRRSTNPENKREKVREAWTIGKLIKLHASEYTLWADYHAYLIKKLSQDLNIKWEDLLRMRCFARSYSDAESANE